MTSTATDGKRTHTVINGGQQRGQPWAPSSHDRRLATPPPPPDFYVNERFRGDRCLFARNFVLSQHWLHLIVVSGERSQLVGGKGTTLVAPQRGTRTPLTSLAPFHRNQPQNVN